MSQEKVFLIFMGMVFLTGVILVIVASIVKVRTARWEALGRQPKPKSKKPSNLSPAQERNEEMFGKHDGGLGEFRYETITTTKTHTPRKKKK